MIRRILKTLFLFSIILVTFSFILKSSYAETHNQEPLIRIGVVPATEEVQIKSASSFFIKKKETEEVIYKGQDEEFTVSLYSTALIETNYRLQAHFTTNEAFRDDWLRRAEAEGYETYVEPYTNGWRLLIGKFPDDASFSEREAFRQEVIAKGLAGNDSFWRLITEVHEKSSLKIVGRNMDLISEEPVVISSDQHLIMINGTTYRGVAEINFNSSGTLVAINELPLEQYLYGVVPRELPPDPFHELEAQKAQAVAARTYAYANLGKRSQDGYDLLATTADQVYGGYDAEHPLSTQAVDETAGIVATYAGELISAVYHSTSGGYTANNEDVWNSEPVPYRRAVHVFDRSAVAINSVEELTTSKSDWELPVMDGSYEEPWSRYYRWEFQWTNEEISNILSDYFNTDVGDVHAIHIVSRAEHGRVLEIEFITDQGTFREYKDRIRWALQYVNDQGNFSPLLSTLFTIEPIKDEETGETIGFLATGGGWGHGVGMSQTGAVGMAEKGKTYDEILKHFYRGIELVNIQNE